eukprot:gnl/Spiro4/28555_TR14117_c0_g2_i1.p3 gnl/Spiro4/28555_TR14117_c0_g2~~gnl/Spiro4/28555_TR14117_c0_g2_i1.p3  ORF type:complete len:114 (-),score=20.03 gnl/Spiro4/28555_TR14117_c0_g2_i1:117-458(-)
MAKNLPDNRANWIDLDGLGGKLARAFVTEVFSSGVLELATLRNPRRTLTRTEVFYIEKGSVDVSVHKTKFRVSSGAHFFIPPNNTYQLENVGPEPARLVFFVANTPAGLVAVD